jgi:serine/threonine protein phosphatase 1
MTIYAIGDIHGHSALLSAAHARIAADKARAGAPDAPVVHLGDYCDRGPDTRGVLEMLCAGIDAGAPFICLMGNHDRMMRRFIAPERLPDPLHRDLHWLSPGIGGRETLASYGVTPTPRASEADLHDAFRAAVPARHRAFLDGLRPSYSVDGMFFCHAGVRPGVALKAQAEDDLLWIRAPFLMATGDFGALVVHGHTPTPQASHFGNRVNLDTGAAFGGPLSAAVFEDGKAWLLTESGRAPLEPPRTP